MRAVVLGAGVLGVAAACELQARGVDVTLVEAVGPGSGTSSRGAGLVAEGGWHPTSIRLVTRSLQILRAFAADSAPFRLHEVGSTTLVPAHLAPAARAMARLQRDAGADVREVKPDDLPALPRHAGLDVSGVATALHYPRDAWALPRLYAEIRALLFEEAGGRRVKGAARLVQRDGRARAMVGDDALDADAVVVACGIHTRAILQGAGLDAPLRAYRTQAARLTHPRAHEAPILHDAVQGCYLRPHFNGQLVIGNGTTTMSEDPLRWKAEADEAFVRASLARVRARFPHLGDVAPGDAWAGLDAATPDRLLLAGRHPDLDRLWLLVGGNGHGFMRAPAAGESLAQTILGERPHVDLASYDPARFRGRLSEDFPIREGYSLSEDAEVAARGER